LDFGFWIPTEAAPFFRSSSSQQNSDCQRQLLLTTVCLPPTTHLEERSLSTGDELAESPLVSKSRITQILPASRNTLVRPMTCTRHGAAGVHGAPGGPGAPPASPSDSRSTGSGQATSTACWHQTRSCAVKSFPPRQSALPRPQARALTHRAHRRVESIYSRRSEEPKAACQRKPTAPLALSSSERRHKAPLANLPTAFRPSRPAQQWVFHQAQTEIDNSLGPAIWLSS
jgi:hypothetical protein